jgi:hypothetical protein
MKIASLLAVWLLFGSSLFAQVMSSPGSPPIRPWGRQSLPDTAEPTGSNYDVNIRTDYGARLLLTDTQGHRCSFATDEDATCAQIPTASFGDNSISEPDSAPEDGPMIEEHELDLAPPAHGSYSLEVLPANRESYWINFFCQGENGNAHQITNETMKVNILPTERHRYQVTVGPECPAGFAEGALGRTGGNAFPLLSYAFPASFNLKVPRGQPFHFVIVYGARISQTTFSADLNGTSIASLFHPKPETIESVEIPLQPGRNVARITAAASANQPGRTDLFTMGVMPQEKHP